VTFGYDEFNRLNARTVTQGTLQNYTYSYDRYGNRLTQTPLQGGYTFNPTINPVNNQITTSPYTYDPAGNMLHDLNNAYTYDAEGNLVEVVGPSGTSQYVYDVFNRRIQVQTASATTEYIYDYAGRRVSSWNNRVTDRTYSYKHRITGERGQCKATEVLFPSAHHVAPEERAVIRFIHSAGRKLQNRLCGIFLACDKAIAVEFEKQDADHEARTLVAIKERVVAHNTRRIGRRHVDDVSGLCIGMLLLGTGQRGLQQPAIAQTSSPAVQRQQATVQ
jgi:YD repeat-containing protein